MKYTNIIIPNEKSPKIFSFLRQNIRVSSLLQMFLKIGKYAAGYIKDDLVSKFSLLKNPDTPATLANTQFIDELKNYIKSLGAANVGFTKVTPELMFKGHKACFPNTIVITAPLDRDKLAQAPSPEANTTYHDSYAKLNWIVNKTTAFLQKHGYGAQAGLATDSPAIYPVIAQQAGLGVIGRLGVLVSPELGTAQRIGVVFTSIENLPFNQKQEHGWVREFCDSCKKCARICPGQAISDIDLAGRDPKEKHFKRERCSPQVVANDGCGVCLKSCIFTNTPYENVKRAFEKKLNRQTRCVG